MEKEKRELRSRLTDTWLEGDTCCTLYLSREYTQRCPSDAKGWLIFGSSLSDVGRFQESKQALEKAKGLVQPKSLPLVLAGMGHLYMAMAELSAAETYYRQAVEASRTTTNLVFLGACLAQQGKLGDAERCHQAAIEVATDSPDEAYYNLGLVLRAKEDYQGALSCFEKAIALDEEYEKAKNARDDIKRLFKITAGAA